MFTQSSCELLGTYLLLLRASGLAVIVASCMHHGRIATGPVLLVISCRVSPASAILPWLEADAAIRAVPR